eukprot:TRINITY_DN4100_c0_g1_i1.p2 TRINITY_DN4100_c0_g1~~TRINITY_DN4100_c0_g1_i1.p2  ORF type:complete len:101 (-),score=11.13 TRINITY_DN4100_c0_g1_i1:206-508(-)
MAGVTRRSVWRPRRVPRSSDHRSSEKTETGQPIAQPVRYPWVYLCPEAPAAAVDMSEAGVDVLVRQRGVGQSHWRREEEHPSQPAVLRAVAAQRSPLKGQ